MTVSPKLFFAIAILSLGATEGFRHWWFSGSQTGEDHQYLAWTPPEDAIDRNFSETAGGRALNHDNGQQFFIKATEDDPSVEVIYLDYQRGNRSVLNDLISHTPEDCFPSFGARLVREFPPMTLSVSDEEILIRQWLFENPLSKEQFFVFKIIWSPEFNYRVENFSDGNSALLGLDSTVQRIRLSAARQGLDAPATRMILALVKGTKDHLKASEIFKKTTIDRLSKPK